MSDKLQLVGAFASMRLAETRDKLKFVGHFQRHFALLPSLPAASSGGLCQPRRPPEGGTPNSFFISPG